MDREDFTLTLVLTFFFSGILVMIWTPLIWGYIGFASGLTMIVIAGIIAVVGG